MKQQLADIQSIRRRGSVYLAVLGVATIITALGVGGIMASRVQARSGDDGRDVSDARFAALSALELGRQRVAVNANWRTSNVATGTAAIGGCTVTLAVTNTTNTALSAIPLDPVYMTATASKGTGVKQSFGQSLVAVGTPQDFLGYAVHTAGQLHILSGNRLISNQTVSANGEFKTEGVLEGSVVASKITSSGAVYASVGTLTTSRSLPATTNAETFAAVGTLIAPGNTMSGVAMGPGRNPYGTANANGVYVIRTNSNLTIQNSRIVGTLVIISNKSVTIAGSVSLQPARSDFPALIITGDATFNYTTASLNETSLLVNFNPMGVSANGTYNTTLLDTYPSEIDGLIDVGGQLTLAGTGIVRGAIVDSFTGNDAVKITANPFQVIYDPTLFTSPPNYYTSAVNLVAQAGSLTQIVK